MDPDVERSPRLKDIPVWKWQWPEFSIAVLAAVIAFASSGGEAFGFTVAFVAVSYTHLTLPTTPYV